MRNLPVAHFSSPYAHSFGEMTSAW
jgi:hypothetical protein